ncbi:MAG TPA: hypothetical protein ENN63_09100 [Bacteroidetes bacterium]|nr:hypothetical protein [Bacteroidota bacterium]
MRTWSAILLLLIMPLSQLGLGVGTHYCGGEAVSSRIMWGGNLPDCGMETGGETCRLPHESGVSFTDVPCCDDRMETPPGTGEYIPEAASQFVNPGLAPGNGFPLAYPGIPETPSLPLHTGRSPPTVKKNLQIYLQTFLI